jgi:hypothetical protein
VVEQDAEGWYRSTRIGSVGIANRPELREMLDEMGREFGPIPDDVQRHVDALEWPC